MATTEWMVTMDEAKMAKSKMAEPPQAEKFNFFS